MSADTLDLGIEFAPAEPVEAAPTQPIREAALVALLVQRYTRIAMGANRYAFADHVADQPGFANRIADFIAMDCYGSPGVWPRHYELIGHEIKVSRADWLAELRQPDKAEAFKPYMDRWWLVVSDKAIVRDGELPEGWGLMVRAGGVLRAVVRAPKLESQPAPRPLIAAMMRAVAKTAARSPVPVSDETRQQ